MANWHINTTQVYDVTSVRTYTYKHSHHTRNSVVMKYLRKQCVLGALSPPSPLRLGTRLNHHGCPSHLWCGLDSTLASMVLSIVKILSSSSASVTFTGVTNSILQEQKHNAAWII